ncbi:MAG: hypothetical protein KF826_06250 [Xanthobacteraceae bacterium]|nr:hypothetical protein [Xanthobacteraceae bacterium]MCW5677140.1 hypothetical protein [Xanthobacteraceae bacterium]
MDRPLLRRIADRIKLRWSTFSYNYRWSDYVFLFDGWMAKTAIAVPFVGYLILFNDSVSQHLFFNNLARESSIGFGISSTTRLKFIYYGLIFLGLAAIIYRIRRPYVMRVGTNQFGYVEKALTHFTVSAYIDIHGAIRHEGHHSLHGKYYDAEYEQFVDMALGSKDSFGHRDGRSANWLEAKSRYEGLLRSMLIENFLRNVVKRRISLTICLIFATVGYLLLAVPSVDLFIKVLYVSFK